MALELRDSFSSMQLGPSAVKTPSVPHFQCRRMSMKYFDQTDGDTGRPYRVFRVVMIGDCGAGKTSFIKRIVTGEFDYDSASTIGMDYHLINITMEEFDFDIHIQLWDTAGQERFHSVTRQYFRKSDGILLFYDGSNETSFCAAENWSNMIQEEYEDQTVLLICNKTDLDQKVSDERGIMLADRADAIYTKHSSKFGTGTDHIMKTLARQLANRKINKESNTISLNEESEKRAKICCK